MSSTTLSPRALSTVHVGTAVRGFEYTVHGESPWYNQKKEHHRADAAPVWAWWDPTDDMTPLDDRTALWPVSMRVHLSSLTSVIEPAGVSFS